MGVGQLFHDLQPRARIEGVRYIFSASSILKRLFASPLDPPGAVIGQPGELKGELKVSGTFVATFSVLKRSLALALDSYSAVPS